MDGEHLVSCNSRERVGGLSHSVTITRESQKRMNQGFNHLQDTTDHISKVQICTTGDALEGQDHGLDYSRTYMKTSLPLFAKKRICTMPGNNKY